MTLLPPELANIFLVGLPGVGKSTMLQLVAKNLNLPAVDAEKVFLENLAHEQNSPLRPLSFWDKKIGYDRVSQKALNFFIESTPHWRGQLVATIPRTLYKVPFWDCAHSSGVTLHLRCLQGQLLHRRTERKRRLIKKLCAQQGKLEPPTEPLYFARRKIFYYWNQSLKNVWNLQAHYQLWIAGNLEQDVPSLCQKIRAIRNHLIMGGSLPCHDNERGWCFDPAIHDAAPERPIVARSLPPFFASRDEISQPLG